MIEASNLTRTVDAVGTLLLGAEADGGLHLDEGWLVLLRLGSGDSVVDALEVTADG